MESRGAGSVVRSSVASTMILSPALNSRRQEILMASAARPIQISRKKTTVREGTIVTVKNVGKIRGH